jgi:hypothetical protein
MKKFDKKQNHKKFQRPNDNLTRAERRALRSVRIKGDLKILPVDKGNATVILDALDYKQKMAALLEDLAYLKLTEDPTESVEWKTRLLLKKSSLPEEVWKCLCPTDSRTPRLYGLPKIHKQGVPIKTYSQQHWCSHVSSSKTSSQVAQPADWTLGTPRKKLHLIYPCPTNITRGARQYYGQF